ncbi:MAG TPA: amino acid adenylation domain-containing protein, partial [Thermoanaerobaculia bacterium]|nr:amino acid adenylation domain-containing protein [Thermoanaerobaculia bacterium]
VRSPDALLELLGREQVTVFSQTPSAFYTLVQADAAMTPTVPLVLRWVIFGGEALDFQALTPWIERRGDREPRLINLYGITEITVHATWRPVTRADLAVDGSRLGHPLSDLRLYLVDPYGSLVPAGVPGEICVAGEGVARGYLGHPALTAERFVPDPWSGVPGARMYRSGDLARHRPGGDLEYLGRIDFQVKVRGYRIEPGEIEAALVRYPSLAAAVVVARPEGGSRRLIAYCVPASRADRPTAGELRDFAAARLPEHMVPAAFVLLDRLPLTVNGKLDREALPAPGPERPNLGIAYVAPRNEVEEGLARVWREVLGLERVGVHDSFFALGGDSILSLRAHSLAAEQGLRFELPQLFTYPTIAGLARETKAGAGASSAGHVSPETAPFSLLTPEDRRRLPGGLDDAFPLSTVQAGMLYHMRYSPGAIVYHNVYSHRLRCQLDPEAFLRAAQRVVDRHPILRTSFDLTSYDEPLQLVHSEATIRVGVVDLSLLSSAGQERALDDLMEAEKRRRFDPARPPLVRLYLHRRDDESFQLTYTEFHPIFDGWSLHAFLAEVFAGYFALLDGRSLPDEPPPRLGMRDFVSLERAAAEAPDCRAYWTRVLTGARPSILPRWSGGESPSGPAIRTVVGALAAPVQEGLRRLARAAAVPLKTVLLSAHLEVLSRIGGGPGLLTGVLVNGRPEGPDGDRALGLFFSVVPFRTPDVDGTWRDLVQATFAAEREMLPFRRYPLARMQQNQGGKPLFDVLFNFIHFYVLRDLLESSRVALAEGSRRWEETHMPLSVTFTQDPVGETLWLELRYDCRQIAPWQAEALSRTYRRTLAAMALAPEERRGLRLLLNPAEKHQILVEWSGAGSALRPQEPRGTVFGLFRAQAERAPDAIAAVCEEQILSYAGLAARAGRVARWLRRAGVGPETRVGISMQRSPDLLAAMLGVLAAGGAYVPLDPAFPPERTGLLLEEAGISLVITHRRLARSVPLPQGLAVLELDTDWETQRQELAPVHDPGEGAAAYVLFTSGSTGVPKGVVVENRQLVSYVRGILERLAPPAGAHWAMASTFAADLGHTTLFPSLLTGGCLHVLPEDRAANPEAWEEHGLSRPVDILKIVPSHLSALLASPGAAAILPRARLVLGGEALDPGLVARVRALAPDLQVFNHYGPTEATVGVLCGRVDVSHPAGAATVPLGRPLAGSRIHLLDPWLLPVPAGAPGELCIAGTGLARGYLGQPGATAARFVPDPFGGERGGRLYRTGDQARWLPDGRIEFLGRQDGQVKLRGFRVELREVELELARHPEVREAAAAVRESRAGDWRLVAFAVPAGAGLPTDAELRSFLRRRLPDYMLPAGFVRLAELPRTANGKLDRAALPEVPDLADAWQAGRVAPRNELERAIAAIWQEVLGLDAVGIDDNLFDLGGHSLTLLRIHSKLRSSLERDLPMVALFEHPTIGGLASHLGAGDEMPAAPAERVAARAEARHAALAERRRARSTR